MTIVNKITFRNFVKALYNIVNIYRFAKIVKVTYLWRKCLESYFEKNYKETLTILNSIENTGVDRRPRLYLLKSFVYFTFSDFENSIENINMAREAIDKSELYTENEKNYLHCYADSILHGIRGVTCEAPLEYMGDTTSVNTENIRDNIKRIFPIIRYIRYSMSDPKRVQSLTQN